MTKLIDCITEHLIGHRAIPSRDLGPLMIESYIEPASDVGKQYKLRLIWHSTVTIDSSHGPRDLSRAKELLIERVKLGMYNDLLTKIFEVEDALHDYDVNKAVELLRELRQEVLR